MMIYQDVPTTPIIPLFDTFDAEQDYLFNFTSIAGSKIVCNNLKIENTSNNKIIYNKKVLNDKFNHKILANTLTNGNIYRFYIRTKDIYNIWSNWSLSIICETSKKI